MAASAVARVVAALVTMLWCVSTLVEGKLGEPRRTESEAPAVVEASEFPDPSEPSLEKSGTSETPETLESPGSGEVGERPAELAVGEVEAEVPPATVVEQVQEIGEVLEEANFKYSGEGEENHGVPFDESIVGGVSRDLERWAMLNSSNLNLASGVRRSLWHGHEYLATTTHYEDTCCGSCGRVDTAALVAGTDYYAVASAEAMQSHFGTGSCCWCGESAHNCGHGSGTAPMGCTACAKGRFIRRRPYSQSLPAHGWLFEKEFKIVVADICPHKGNEAWCPRHVGRKNNFGSKNHFDFASPPPGFDNFYFAFTPMACSQEILNRVGRMSMCHRQWR